MNQAATFSVPPSPSTRPPSAPPGEGTSDPLAETPYRVIGPLGRGGMGDVLEAEHAALGKRVVVKLLRRQLAGRQDLVDRMRVEAQILARIHHPNLVSVSDFGVTADGRPFLVMERLYGRTMREELRRRGAFPADEAVEYLRQALAGLAAAHIAGIVHRDVKLENLFLCDPIDGHRTVKVLDFGIAKIVSGGADPRVPAPLAFPTAMGVAVGTPRYFSPEQARGLPLDQRSDVYAAGIVLYTLVAGRGPFDHLSAMYDVARAHALEVPAPPSAYAPRPIPPELDRAILKALAKRPDDRYPTAAMFSAELLGVAARAARPLPFHGIRWGRAEADAASERREGGGFGVLSPSDKPTPLATVALPSSDNPTPLVASTWPLSDRPTPIGSARAPLPDAPRADAPRPAKGPSSGPAPLSDRGPRASELPGPPPPPAGAARPEPSALAAPTQRTVPVQRTAHGPGDARAPRRDAGAGGTVPLPTTSPRPPRPGRTTSPVRAEPSGAPAGGATRTGSLHPVTFVLVVLLSAAASAALAGSILLRLLA